MLYLDFHLETRTRRVNWIFKCKLAPISSYSFVIPIKDTYPFVTLNCFIFSLLRRKGLYFIFAHNFLYIYWFEGEKSGGIICFLSLLPRPVLKLIGSDCAVRNLRSPLTELIETAISACTAGYIHHLFLSVSPLVMTLTTPLSSPKPCRHRAAGWEEIWRMVKSLPSGRENGCLWDVPGKVKITTNTYGSCERCGCYNFISRPNALPSPPATVGLCYLGRAD